MVVEKPALICVCPGRGKERRATAALLTGDSEESHHYHATSETAAEDQWPTAVGLSGHRHFAGGKSTANYESIPSGWG